MIDKSILINNLGNVHTTELGIVRIKRNLGLEDVNVVKWCVEKIRDSNSIINRRGKNWYIEVDKIIITINAYSYTIITAHKIK